jgi:hypothetical protein
MAKPEDTRCGIEAQKQSSNLQFVLGSELHGA